MRAHGAAKHNCAVHLFQFVHQAGQRMPFPASIASELHAGPIFDCKQKFVPWSVPEPEPPPTPTKRGEPLVLFEDVDNIVIMKPAGWTCVATGVDTKLCHLSLPKRRELAQQLQLQESTAKLAQYLVLRFGAA